MTNVKKSEKQKPKKEKAKSNKKVKEPGAIKDFKLDEKFLERLRERILSENQKNAENFQPEQPQLRVNLEQKTAPVLEEITAGQTGPRFVRTGGQQQEGQTALTNNEDTTATYVTSQAQREDNVYAAGREQDKGVQYVGGQISTTPQRVNVWQAGRDFNAATPFQNVSQDTFIRQSEAAGFGQGSVERIRTHAERIDPLAVGRENPIEAEERKYKKYDFEKKSSY